MQIKHSLNKQDLNRPVPQKFEILLVKDPDYGLCLAGRNFNTGKIFALYDDISSMEKDLDIKFNLPKDTSLMDLSKVTDIRRCKDGTYNFLFDSEQKLSKIIVEQNLVLYGNKTV